MNFAWYLPWDSFEGQRGLPRIGRRAGQSGIGMPMALQRNFIAQVDSPTVVLVTNKNTCSKAMRAYNDVRGAGSQPPSGAVYVIKVGAMYIVRDPVQRNPESGWYGDVVLDSGFRVKSQLLGI